MSVGPGWLSVCRPPAEVVFHSFNCNSSRNELAGLVALAGLAGLAGLAAATSDHVDQSKLILF